MPTYSYRCTECSTAFDIHQEFSDDSLTVCPTCGGKLRKVFGAVGVSFSGSGFYRNDSRPAPKGEGGGSSAASSDAASSSSGSGSGSSGSGSSGSGSSGSGSSSSGAAPAAPASAPSRTSSASSANKE